MWGEVCGWVRGEEGRPADPAIQDDLGGGVCGSVGERGGGCVCESECVGGCVCGCVCVVPGSNPGGDAILRSSLSIEKSIIGTDASALRTVIGA